MSLNQIMTEARAMADEFEPNNPARPFGFLRAVTANDIAKLARLIEHLAAETLSATDPRQFEGR
jgi:hypothetical protein